MSTDWGKVQNVSRETLRLFFLIDRTVDPWYNRAEFQRKGLIKIPSIIPIVNLPVALICMVVSIAVIVKGGDLFVSAASWMAEVSGIPKLIVGATVVSMATTLPEMLVSAFSAVSARTSGNVSYIDMSIGNAVGSVTANTGLILAIALIFMAGAINRREYLLKAGLFIGAAAVIAGFGVAGSLGLVPNLILLVLFVAAMTENVLGAVREIKAGKALDGGEVGEGGEGAPGKTRVGGRAWAKNVTLFLVGAAAIGIGANVLVNSAEFVANAVGVPERVIAVTILAIGTSLPELVTTITAVVKREMSLSAGNIIGANIMDMTLIMPICGLISGKALPVTEQVGRIDLPASLLIALVAMIPALWRGKFMRWQGIVLLSLYVGYLVLTCFFGDLVLS